jgi:serine/threonine-protein kinase
VDARSDIYSMGVLLYQCVTGALPFTADSPIAIAMKHVTQAPIPPRAIDPAIPERLERGILKTLAKDPAQRFQTADEFAEFLEDPELRAVLSAPPHLDALLHSAATLIGTMPTVEGEPATAVEHLEVQRAASNETATLIEGSVSAPGAPGGVPAGFLAAAGSAAAAGSIVATGSIAGSAGMERVPAVSLAAGSPEALSAAAVAAGLAPPLQPPANRLKPGDWVIAAVLLGLGVLIAYLLWPVLIR